MSVRLCTWNFEVTLMLMAEPIVLNRHFSDVTAHSAEISHDAKLANEWRVIKNSELLLFSLWLVARS